MFWCYYCRTDSDKARVNSALQHNSKYMSKFNFDLFERKINFFGFPCCGTHEDLPIDVSITTVGLIVIKLGWFQHFGTSQYSYKSKFNFNLLWEEVQFFGFPFCSTHKDLPINLSITTVGLILTKLEWFQHFGTSQNTRQISILTFYEGKSNFWVPMQ